MTSMARISVVAAAFSLLLTGCFSKEPEHQNLPAAHGEQAVVQVRTLESQPSRVFSHYPATVVASEQSPIASRMMGFVQKIHVAEGEYVEKGAPLVDIDQADIDAQITQARAMLDQAKSGLADAQRNFERSKNLYDQEALPKQQFEQSQTGLEQARAQVERARAGLEQAQTQTRYTQMTAPFSGTVVERMIDTGQLATPGQPLLMLQSDAGLEVAAELPDSAYRQLNAVTELPVQYRDGAASEEFIAPLLKKVAAANPMTRTHTVKLAVPESVALHAGAFVRVSVPVAEQEQVTIPAQALHTRAGIRGVFVVDERDYARFRLVEVQSDQGEYLTVLSGLQAGDRLIVDSDRHLFNGLKVEVESAS